MIIYKIIVKIILKLHNFSYRLATKLAIKTEGGLHPKHRLMNYHKFFVENVDSGNLVLDIGCGNGALTYDLAKKARKVIGIDLSPENIRFAKRRYSAPNIDYLVGDAIGYKFEQKFNVIILSNVLEHIKNRIEFLKSIRNMAPKVLIRVPAINRDWITLYKKELGVEWRLDKTHYVEYTLENLRDELEKVGLNLEKYSIQFGEIWGVVFAKL